MLCWFAVDGAIDGVDQHLGLDEFEPCPLGLVAVERRGERLGEGVAVVGHALARLFQRLKSLAHVGFAFCWSRGFVGAKSRARNPVGVRFAQNSGDTRVKPVSVRYRKYRHALPERRVTIHYGDTGYTIGPFARSAKV